MKVSIITACYNSERTISRTIESVLNQTYDNIEYIIVDGLSSDGTLGIINKYCEKFGNRLKVISEKDNGMYEAMNKGINASTGDLIGIINSDDYYELDAVENVVKMIAENNEDGSVFYGFQRNTINGETVDISFRPHTNLKKTMINHPTCFVSKSVYEKHGVFDTTYKSAADYELMLRLFLSGSVQFVPLYKLIANFELGGTSLNGTGISETADIMYKYNLISKKEYVLRKVWSKLFALKRKVLLN